MSDRGQHSEWLSLIDVSGPFLAEPVLKEAFPQGLEGLDATKKKTLRQAYDEWREALDLDDPQLLKIHRAWVDLVLRQGLELDEDGKGDVLKAGKDVPETLKCGLPEHGLTLRPDYAMVDGQSGGAVRMLVSIHPPDVALTHVLKHDGWTASPAERMVELCRGTEVRLGLVTNGEHWMFVDAPVGKVTSLASWYARHWGQEPVTLQAFVNLLGIRRFFVDRTEQLPALLDKSLEHQDEVTDALGEQVTRAVEVLIQALDRADVDRNRELLKGVQPAELYEAGLTVMMRIVFLLSAEERGLLLMGDPRYEANYAISTLRMQLRSESPEILERRWDAWSRLLSTFRAVYGGIDHDVMRLPALGGSLFDPDRFPFLEGRTKGSKWKTDLAVPLPIDNRTVLLLLDAVQLFQGRTLSYLALDVEQIGYVYEGLLERTASRAVDVTLDLDATKNADKPWVSLPELDDTAAKGRDAVEKLLKDRIGSSASRVRKDLGKQVDEASSDKLLTVCHGDRALRDRIKPYFQLLRTDPWGYPLVYPKGTFMVTAGSDRRETGTHYTPKSLTEAIVKETLEPLVYVGPAEEKSRDTWRLKSPAELLDLKICDPAMGSGAFLVQVCRWLSERLVETWAQAENQGQAISSDGQVLDVIGSLEPLRTDPEERLVTARRLIAERCLYGVDLNPLAVELAKLSIWLVTLAKGRPFGFLDHNLRCGDSLLGVTSLDQLHYLEMKPGEGSSRKLFASALEEPVAKAVALRSRLRQRTVVDIHDIEEMTFLNTEARESVALTALIANALSAEIFLANGKPPDVTKLSIHAGEALRGNRLAQGELAQLADANPQNNRHRAPLHWALEYPEVFTGDSPGFDAILGNPPFLGGKRISYRHGDELFNYLKYFAGHAIATTDLCVFFLLRSFQLLHPNGYLGLVLSDIVRQGDSRETGLEDILARGATIYSAVSTAPWPGKAGVRISNVFISKGPWRGRIVLDHHEAKSISSFLRDEALNSIKPQELPENTNLSFTGHYLMGQGFVLTNEQAEKFVAQNERSREVIFEYIRGDDVNNSTKVYGSAKVIHFGTRSLEECRKQFPECLDWVEKHVKPERDKKRGPERSTWWLFARPRQTLETTVSAFNYVIVQPFTAKYVLPSYVPARAVFAHPLVVFGRADHAFFALLQSSLHNAWAREYCSTSLDLMRYTANSIISTFPLPTHDDEKRVNLERIGRIFLENREAIRSARAVCNNDVMNEFHDPNKHDVSIVGLREQLRRLDDGVCGAYGWGDVDLAHDFRKTKYGVRFEIAESARAELLRRITNLNQTRFQQSISALKSAPSSSTETLISQDLFSPREKRHGEPHG